MKEVPGFQGATEDHTDFMGSFTYIIRFSPMTTLQKRLSKVKKARKHFLTTTTNQGTTSFQSDHVERMTVQFVNL